MKMLLAVQAMWALVLLLSTPVLGQTMSNFFQIDSTCTRDGRNINGLLSDALTMLSAAQVAITNVRGATSFPSNSNNRFFMRNARHSFGTQYYSTSRGFPAATS